MQARVFLFFRCSILEISSCLVKGANDNLVEIIYNLTIHSFQVFLKGWAELYFCWYNPFIILLTSICIFVKNKVNVCLICRQLMKVFIMKHTTLWAKFWRYALCDSFFCFIFSCYMSQCCYWMMQEHPCYSSKYMELIDLLLSIKPPTDVASLRNRFVCFHTLMIHIVKVRNLKYDIISFFIYIMCRFPWVLGMRMCNLLWYISSSMCVFGK